MAQGIMQRLVASLRRGAAEPESLSAFREAVSRFNASQPNAALLDAIRAYNHQCLDFLNQVAPLRGKRLLEIGASPHGYALERALELGPLEYIGIGLDVAQTVEVNTPASTGRLFRMDGQNLLFPAAHFDLVLSISTFEHVSSVPAVLAEIERVLKPGGKALITFEPVWTCSYGHHLHHFGEISKLMPDWAHLIWTRSEMLGNLAAVWPAEATPSLEEAACWVYDSDGLNRIGLVEMREHFYRANMAVEWMVPIQDVTRDAGRLTLIAQATGLAPSDLMTKGLSVLLRK